MIKFLVCCTVLAAVVIVVKGMGDNMIGPGRWYVLSIAQCDNNDQYEQQYFIQRKKLTRDQDCYNANITLKNPLDDNYAIRIDICKFVDGGCKPYQVMSDESFIHFVEKFAKENVEEALKMAGIDPPKFPLDAGNHTISNYVFNYAELPEQGMYGRFGVDLYILDGGEDIGCVHLTVNFENRDDLVNLG
ncbi:uncharacterized protein LOC114359791 isoform X2 [Ostrinia furnacalis]|uniref:uncharacterized protein LOC114359791 isoform X2 n=1 Tax=Ostrinia furnacalis TaxID=93504 RepID=UPI00103D0EB0|nr:uncharacterized protein LOC114359791 isoform X2 [Ostrinia furnacalis]